MKNLIKLCIVICLLNTNCISPEIKSQDEPEQFYKHYESKDHSYIFLATDKCFEIIDSVFSIMPQLSVDSDKEEHCNWISLYVNEVSNELIKHFGKKDQIYEIVAYTKKGESEYFNFHNDECNLINPDKLPESVKNDFNKVFRCANPNDPNRIKPDGFMNSISKRFPKTGDVKHLIRIFYNGDGEKIIYKKQNS